MSNTYKFCGCRGCRVGRSSKRNRAVTRNVMRKFRRECKQALRRGDETPAKISIPYTD